ncbi:unnamed protein product [Orchesella dallaii]|uniref:Uncharacterized protein n=1 Tax=Orchesella dallaii TaxID=48710 RepID=A0ABP1S1W1_9HEXA
MNDLSHYTKLKTEPIKAVVIGEKKIDGLIFFNAYESEVLGTILEQNIRVFSLEGPDYHTIEPALKPISELSGGLHFLIGNGEDDETNVATVISEIDEILKAGAVPPSRYRVVHKDSIRYNSSTNGNPYPIFVPYSNVKKLTFFIDMLNTGYVYNLKITKGPENVNLPDFRQTYYWGEIEYTVPRYLAEIEQSLSEPTEWEYSYECGSTECYSLMVAIVELEESPSSPIPGDDIEITVTTSSEEDFIADLNVESATSLKGTEFAIYARLEKNGHPINSPNLTVTAHVSFFSDDASVGGLYPKIVPLLDDGAGNPDLTANDGIYSGSILPISYPGGERGVYQITVSASHRHQQEEGKRAAAVMLKTQGNSTKTSPLPVDQVSIRCGSGYQGCFSERVTEPFMKYADLKRRIEFRGTDTFFFELKAAASRILDFKVEPLDNASDTYRFSWTEPKIMTAFGAGRARIYVFIILKISTKYFQQ